jgi:hypothetical protein
MYIRVTPVHQVRRQLRGLAAFSEADAAETLSGRGRAVRTKNIESYVERIWMLQSVGFFLFWMMLFYWQIMAGLMMGQHTYCKHTDSWLMTSVFVNEKPVSVTQMTSILVTDTDFSFTVRHH